MHDAVLLLDDFDFVSGEYIVHNFLLDENIVTDDQCLIAKLAFPLEERKSSIDSIRHFVQYYH